MKNKISICMPTFNHHEFIGETIESIINSTHKEFELIISDNNMNEKTKKIVHKFNDKRIIYLKNKNFLAPSENWNNTFLHATGKYISLMSSDDVFSSDKLEMQLEKFETSKEKLSCIFSNAYLIDKNSKEYIDQSNRFKFMSLNKNMPRAVWIKTFLNKGNFVFCTSAFFARNSFKRIGLFDKRYLQLHDFDFWLRLLTLGNFYVINKPLLGYRVLGDDNLSSPSKKKSVRSNYELMHIYKNFNNFKLSDLSLIDTKLNNITNKNLLVALLCLKIGNNAGKLFGLNYIHQNIDNFLQSGFGINDFYDMTAGTDFLES